MDLRSLRKSQVLLFQILLNLNVLLYIIIAVDCHVLQQQKLLKKLS